MRILFCEDDKDTADAIVLTLRGTGHTVDYAMSADQAVSIYDMAPNAYDLIITDVEMPLHSGMYFASHARASGYQGRLAVLTGTPKERVIEGLQKLNAEFWAKTEIWSGLLQMVNGEGAPPAESVSSHANIFSGDVKKRRSSDV